MTKRKQLQELQKNLKNIDKSHDKLYKESFDLSYKVNKIGLELIREEKLLKNTQWAVWHYDYGDKSFFTLHLCDEENNKNNIIKIKKLLKLNYHDSANLKNDIKLKVDDNDTKIEFGDINSLKKFIKESEIIVSFDDLNKKINDYTENCNTLKEFITEFNG